MAFTLSRLVLAGRAPALQGADVMEPRRRDVVHVLHWLASLSPTRLTGGHGERKVQDAIASEMTELGYRIDWQPFRFSRNIYGSLALHFGLGVAFALLGLRMPAWAAAGHALVAISFVSEAAYRRHFLRALWPKVDTQNLLCTRPAASGHARKRLVFAAHVDSAYTGFMFRPSIIRLIGAPPPSFLPFLRKQLMLPLVCLVALSALELSRLFADVPAWPAYVLLLPPLLVFVLNAQVVFRNEVVPGAGDNLTGCAAQLVLAEELSGMVSDDTEVVFAFTGCEEAGTGGAAHLARTMSASWDRENTSVIVLDTLSNGSLFMLEEGELMRREIPPDLAAEVELAARDAGGPVPRPYIIPAGATDALPFLVEGYRALALTCIDEKQHAPRNYHHPDDTADRVDPAQLRASVLIASALMKRLTNATPAAKRATADERARDTSAAAAAQERHASSLGAYGAPH